MVEPFPLEYLAVLGTSIAPLFQDSPVPGGALLRHGPGCGGARRYVPDSCRPREENER